MAILPILKEYLMPMQSITLSSASVPGVSGAAMMNWRCGKPATVTISISTTGTSSAAVLLEFTMDDLMLVGGSSNAFWMGVSSVAGQAQTTFNASNFGAGGVQVAFPTPVAAVRMNSTALSSGPLTMKVMQGEGG
jgi:hypothetical protein